MSTIKPIPEGYHSVTPYLFVKGAEKAIQFYKQAFGAAELMHMKGPDGTICHAEIKIGNSIIMLADENPKMNARSPESYGGSPISLLIYVENVDAMFIKATAAGATVVRPIQDQFYGDRLGSLSDPFGHVWSIATHKEDLTPAEIHKRFEAMTVS